jgi:glycogen debranching enzyme
MDSNMSQAYETAVKCLRSSYSNRGILAGSTHFNDLWARDACFACLGALELKDYDIVKRTLATLLRYQRKDGLLPFRVGDYNIFWKLWGIKIKKKVRPRYVDDKRRNLVLDSNSLVIILANEYVNKSKDLDFAKKYYPQLKKALDYYGSDLVKELPYGNWCDSVPKKGRVLYTNVLYWKAIVALDELGKNIKSAEGLDLKADAVKEKINRVFWNGLYFNDTDHNSVFATCGNLLALVFGLASSSQKNSTLKFVEKNCLAGFTIKTSHPEYKECSFIDRLGGMCDYHNLRWLWIACLYSLFKKEMLNRIADKINQHNMVYEVYEKNGRPVKRWFYKSEKNFSWSCGLFIYAVNKTK